MDFPWPWKEKSVSYLLYRVERKNMRGLLIVDNHMSILLRIKNPKESSHCPEATVGLNRGQSVVHRKGGPRTGDTPPSEYSTTPLYNFILPITTESPSTTPAYNCALLLLPTKKNSTSRSLSNSEKYQSQCLALCLDCCMEILVSSIPLVYNGYRFLRFLY